MKKSYIVWGVIIILAIISFTAVITIKQHNVKDSNKTALTTIKIGYRAHDLFAPLFIGLEKGIFIKYGLVVEPIKFESANQITDALIAGRIDATLGGINTFLLLTVEDKSPGYFKIFSIAQEDSSHASTALLISNSSTLKITDLNNKKIASQPGSAMKALYERLVKTNNLQNTTLIQMDQKLELPALESGQVDAAIVLEPLVTAGTVKKISRPLEVGLWNKYFMKEDPISASVVSQKFIDDNPNVVGSLVKASDECVEIITNQPDELRKILPSYTAVDPNIASQVPVAPFFRYDEINKVKLQELSNLLLELGEIKNPVNAEAMVLSDKYVKDN
ncbi:MAG: ABC transporter substrate-binding protein [Candidatus Magasanikbacteria bacterium]